MANKDDPTPKAHTDDPKAHSSSAFGHKGQDLSRLSFEEQMNLHYTTLEEMMTAKLRLENYIQFSTRDNYIIPNYEKLVDYMDTQSLLKCLVSRGVISHCMKEHLMGPGTGTKTVRQQNEEMVGIMRRLDIEKYFDFLEVLADNQKDLVQLLTDGDFFETRLRLTEALISEDGGSIKFHNFDLQIQKNSVEKPVTVSVKMIDCYPMKNKVISTGLQDIVQPIMHFGLEPHGQKFLRSVSLALNQNIPKDKIFLIFHKDIDHKKETEWTDITDKSNYKYTEGKLSFQIDSFSLYWIWAVLPNFQALCWKLLNRKSEVCAFFAYYKPGQQLKVFVEKKKENPDHKPPTDYELYDGDTSWCPLFAAEDLAFYNNYHHEPVERSINMDGFMKPWEEIDLPKNFTPRPPPLITVKRQGIEKNLCKLQLKSQDPSRLSFEEQMNLHYTTLEEMRDDKEKRLDNYIQLSTRDEYISKHYKMLVNKMNTKNLLPSLVSSKVINLDEKEGITGPGTGEKTVRQQNEEMVGIMRRLDKDKYFVFLEVLAEYQIDLVQHLTEWDW